MRLSEYERKLLLSSPIYLKYAKTGFSSVTLASILADLNNITYCSIDTLPLIKFLTQLAAARGWSQDIDVLTTINSNNTSARDAYLLDAIRLAGITANDNRPLQCSDLDIHYTEHTLSGGGIAAAALYAPGTGYTYQSYWAILGCNGAGLANQNYVIKYQDETGPTSFFELNWRGGDNEKHWIIDVGSADDKDLVFTVSGGSGTEHIWCALLAGKYT